MEVGYEAGAGGVRKVMDSGTGGPLYGKNIGPVYLNSNDLVYFICAVTKRTSAQKPAAPTYSMQWVKEHDGQQCRVLPASNQ